MRYTDARAHAGVKGNDTGTPPEEFTAVYVRLSLDAAGDGLGVERQERECRELAQRNGWEVSEVFADNDISATTGKRRPEFERLLQSKPTRIIAWHSDRIARKTPDLMRVIALDVPVYTVSSGILDLSNPAGRAVAKTVTAWSEYEGEQKSLRQQASHRQRARSGKSFWAHRRPFGFTEHGEHHETEAPALREVFRMVREGQTYAACATWLTEQGFTTTRGERWEGPRLSRTMRHPRNAGLSVYKTEIVGPAEWDPIVSEEEWRAILSRSEAMPRAVGDPRGGKRVKSLLGGMVRCSECGDPVRQTRQQSKRKSGEIVRTRVYQPACHHVSINADWLDAHVTKRLLRHMTSPVRYLQDGPEITDDEAQAAAREAVSLRERLDDVARREAGDEITERQAKVQTDVLRTRLAEAEERATAYYSASPLDRALSPAQVVGAWKDDSLSLQHRREAVAKYIESITLRPREHRNERANPGMVVIKMRK